MRQGVYHVCHHKDDSIEITPPFQLLHSRRDGQQENSMKALRKIDRPSRPVRYLPQEQLRKGWIARMRLDHGFDDCAYQILEWCSSMLYESVLNHAVNLIDVTLVEGVKDRAPVGKILVKRANTHAGDFSNPIGCDSI